MGIQQILYPENPSHCWEKAVSWAQQFRYTMILDDHHIAYPQKGFPRMVMAGSVRILKPSDDSFNSLHHDRTEHGGWLAGILSYDLKNSIENLSSENPAFIPVDDLCFFAPEHVLIFHETQVEIHTQIPGLFQEILASPLPQRNKPALSPPGKLVLQPDRNRYLKTVEEIRQHIIEGDIYELNYCVEFGLAEVDMCPLDIYRQLMTKSPTPFSVFSRFEHLYTLSASPERFLRKTGSVLLSQPIKGTARRYDNPGEDLQSKEALFNSEKERAENLMIVDLVRNDLARSAEIGSVHVPELFGIYSFQHWHQMISSVRGTLKARLHGVEAIRNAFPMGSMTGAPKIKAMQLIENYESSRRGIYSGALGYFNPDDDFDFNVVIRSMIYDSSTRHLSFSVGSAITYDSDPAREFEECMLKASAIFEVLAACGIAPSELLKIT